jgi:hypothetical protein
MIRFDSKSGNYTVDFAVTNKKRKMKFKGNVEEENGEPIVLFPGGDVVYFHKDSGKYSASEKEESTTYDWEEVYEEEELEKADTDDGEYEQDVDDVVDAVVDALRATVGDDMVESEVLEPEAGVDLQKWQQPIEPDPFESEGEEEDEVEEEEEEESEGGEGFDFDNTESEEEETGGVVGPVVLDDIMGPEVEPERMVELVGETVGEVEPEVLYEDDEIYQMELELDRERLIDLVGQPVGEEEEEDDEEDDEEDEPIIPRDAFIDTHNIGLIKGINAAVKEAGRNIPKTVLETVPNEIFDRSNMVKLSYDISGARNNMDLDAAGSEFQDAVQSESLVFMPEYSNRDAAVVYDSAKRIYHVAFHGANAEGGNSVEDWQSIKNVMGIRFDRDPQYLRSEKNLELFLKHISEVDPTAGVELTGYSLGGSTSLHLAEKFNLDGMHINSFTSPLSKYEINDTDSLFRARQQMVRIVNDPYSGQSAIRPPRHVHNRDYTTLLPLKENVSFDDAHSLNQFTTKRPRGINNLVEKSNVVGQGLGKAATVAGGIYGGYLGYKQGRDASGSLSEESYRAVLGATESTLPIVGEGDILESGIVGFTQSEISNAFTWVRDSIFGKPEEESMSFRNSGSDAPPPGYVQVSGQGFTPPP